MSIKQNKPMKRFIPLIIVTLILAGIGVGVLYYQHQEAVDVCKEECNYRTPENTEAYWRFGSKKLETQEQCIDWCFNVAE